ncbi:MAG: hypothetical protein H7244_06050 [Herminiimonas sp.]|nr:hypothetical protein [Herminiimonas sp.]
MNERHGASQGKSTFFQGHDFDGIPYPRNDEDQQDIMPNAYSCCAIQDRRKNLRSAGVDAARIVEFDALRLLMVSRELQRHLSEYERPTIAIGSEGFGYCHATEAIGKREAIPGKRNHSRESPTISAARRRHIRRHDPERLWWQRKSGERRACFTGKYRDACSCCTAIAAFESGSRYQTTWPASTCNAIPCRDRIAAIRAASRRARRCNAAAAHPDTTAAGGASAGADPTTGSCATPSGSRTAPEPVVRKSAVVSELGAAARVFCGRADDEFPSRSGSCPVRIRRDDRPLHHLGG